MKRMSDNADRLWTDVVTKAFVMELVELIAPEFAKMTIHEGQQIRYISVQDVDYKGKTINDVIHIDLVAKLLTDQGHWDQPMIIRVHRTPSRFNSEMRLYDVLCDRAAKFDDIHETRKIFSDSSRLFAVYESVASDSILNLDPLLIDFSLGRIAAVMHGYDVNNFKTETLVQSLFYILEYMPFDKDLSESVKNLLNRRLQQVPYTLGGYIPCTAFTPSLLKIKFRIEDRKAIDLFSVASGKAFDTYIPMGVVDEDFHDRFEDVANFFAEDAFLEFLQSNGISETKERIERFLTGYSMISKETFGIDLKSLYPEGYILDLQLLLSVWINEVNSFDATNPDLQRMTRLGEFSIFLLSSGILDSLEVEMF